MEQIDEDEEINAILKRLMPVLPSFSGKNFDLWKMKMEGLLGSVDLWEFVQIGYEDLVEKRKDKITLYLVSSALNNDILSALLYEFGEIDNAKMFWDIIEMKYNDEHKTNASLYEETFEIDGEYVEFYYAQSHMNNDDWDEDFVLDNDNYVEGFVIETEINESIADKSESLVKEDLFEGETYEVRFDKDNLSHEEWSNLMHDKHLIDELMFGEKNYPLACANQLEDNFIVEEKEEKEDEEEKN